MPPAPGPIVVTGKTGRVIAEASSAIVAFPATGSISVTICEVGAENSEAIAEAKRVPLRAQ